MKKTECPSRFKTEVYCERPALHKGKCRLDLSLDDGADTLRIEWKFLGKRFERKTRKAGTVKEKP